MTFSLPERIRKDFPILSSEMNGKPLVYFDNGATTQKPQSVIDAISEFYRTSNANIHRGVYELSQEATDQYENARAVVARFLGGVDPAECIFTRGTTESINLVANSWGRHNLRPSDEILITGLEHHSNIVPWQLICMATGASLRVVQPNADGEIELSDFRAAVSIRTRLVAIQSISNAIGTIHDIESMIQLARGVGAKVLIDAAQSVGHLPTRLGELDCDFLALSGHKLYGPTGIGVLWGRRELLEVMPPFLGGGDMIETVSFAESTFAGLPNRFEAGTPHIAGAIGLAAAIGYVQSIGFKEIVEHETQLLQRLTSRLDAIDSVRIVGRAKHKASIVSFVVERPAIAPLDVATQLSFDGIAIRTGHHCCMPLMEHFGVAGTCRASMAMYNTLDEVDYFADCLETLVADQARSIDSSPRAKSGNVSVSSIAFAAAVGSSPESVADELIDDFDFCDDPQSKTQLLLELGQELPDAFSQLKAMTTLVPGCMSEVYLMSRPSPDDPSHIEFAGDSNAQIVRGLISLLQKLWSGQAASAVLEFDIDGFFRRIGLDQFITSQRRNGLAGMIAKIRGIAHSMVSEAGKS